MDVTDVSGSHTAFSPCKERSRPQGIDCNSRVIISAIDSYGFFIGIGFAAANKILGNK